MQAMYQMIGISKQGHYKRVAHQERVAERSSAILAEARALREQHKRLGCRKLYHELKPAGMGRDRTEALLLSNGFRLKRKRSYHRTTYAGKKPYPNLISGLELSDVNQLWVSDITYIPVGAGKPFYLTLVSDVYSRKIKGWNLSATMMACDTVIPAYKQAIVSIGQVTLEWSLIFHSDKGGQYLSHELRELHIANNVRPSMGGKAWENAHAESLNGILKNEYIDFSTLTISLEQGRELVKKIIEKYNTTRPHGSLKNRKPEEFETFVAALAPLQKPRYKINY